MTKKINYKVPGGKLLRITAKLEDDLLLDIKITGDFFLHPEEKIEKIEDSLKGKKVEETELEDVLREIVMREGITLLGVSEKDFVEALMKLKE